MSMQSYDFMKYASEWHALRAKELEAQFMTVWPLTRWFVEEGHALYRPEF